METNTKILFICNGNIGISIIAESYYNKFTHSSDASSAIVNPTNSKGFEIISPLVLRIMNEVKIDISSQKIEILTEEMVLKADRIILFCKKEDCPIFLLKHPSVYLWEVKNLDKTTFENYCLIRDEIELLVYKKLMKVEY